jgi:hypothetical protein
LRSELDLKDLCAFTEATNLNPVAAPPPRASKSFKPVRSWSAKGEEHYVERRVH